MGYYNITIKKVRAYYKLHLPDHFLLSPALLDQNTIRPACLHQPEKGVFGLFTVVQGLGDVEESGRVIAREIMEISDYQVAWSNHQWNQIDKRTDLIRNNISMNLWCF